MIIVFSNCSISTTITSGTGSGSWGLSLLSFRDEVRYDGADVLRLLQTHAH